MIAGVPVKEHATLLIELGRLAAVGIGLGEIETYGNGVRHVMVPDPDGNALAFAEMPTEMPS